MSSQACPRVHHKRQVVAVRKGNLGGKSLALYRAGGIVVVVVEPALPYRHQLGLPLQKRLYGRNTVLGVVRVEPDSCPNPVVGLSHAQRRGRVLRVGPDRNEPGNPRRPSLLNRFDADPFVRDMAMVIAPHGGASRTGAGKGAPLAPPGGHPGTHPTCRRRAVAPPPASR